MKALKFHFGHPFKGKASLTPLNILVPIIQNFDVETDANNLIEVPVDHCDEGKWKIVLEWERDGRNFSHQKVFVLKK